jgi:hypothetical protein
MFAGSRFAVNPESDDVADVFRAGCDRGRGIEIRLARGERLSRPPIGYARRVLSLFNEALVSSTEGK